MKCRLRVDSEVRLYLGEVILHPDGLKIVDTIKPVCVESIPLQPFGRYSTFNPICNLIYDVTEYSFYVSDELDSPDVIYYQAVDNK